MPSIIILHNLSARTKTAFTFLPEIKFSFVHVTKVWFVKPYLACLNNASQPKKTSHRIHSSTSSLTKTSSVNKCTFKYTDILNILNNLVVWFNITKCCLNHGKAKYWHNHYNEQRNVEEWCFQVLNIVLEKLYLIYYIQSFSITSHISPS
jgi:hypothetical protein